MAEHPQADSLLPGDSEFTWTKGDNYGLDGFQFDEEYGDGVLDAARLPEAKGLSDLPDGMIPNHTASTGLPDVVAQHEDKGVGVLDHLVAEQRPTLPDLAWLEDAVQDPARLPEQPHGLSIPELEDAWGRNRRTDGVNLVAAVDRESAAYHQGVEAAEKAPSKSVLAEVLRKATRKSAAGVPMGDVLRGAHTDLGGTLEPLRPALEVVRDEHGLAGNIFVRASAYPGCHQGKWKEHIRKTAAKAQYVIKSARCADCVHATGGCCSQFGGKTLVGKVPWKRALASYGPALKDSGRKISSGDPKEVLRKAFLSEPELVTPNTVFPTRVEPSGDLSLEDAWGRLAKTEKPKGPRTNKKAQKAVVRARVQMAKWQKAGLLSQGEAKRLLESGRSPNDMVRLGALLISKRNRGGEYGGQGVGKGQIRQASDQQAKLELEASRLEAQEARQALMGAARIKFHGEVERLARSNRISSEQAAEILASSEPLGALQQRVAAMVAGLGHKSTYGGQGEGVMPKYDISEEAARKQLQAKKKTSQKRDPEVAQLLKWARRQMNEGAAGKDLSDLMRLKFSSSVRKKAKADLSKLRERHEGLAGHLYVEARAYSASQGCDEGSLKHRGNGIKHVLAMKACEGCVFANESTCQKYNKRLATKVPTKDPKAYQKEMIRQANASDAERTASLFAPTTSPIEEFGLAGGMESLDLEPEVTSEAFGSVFFGGLDLGTE